MRHTKGPWTFNSDRTALLSISKNGYTPILDLGRTHPLEPSKQDAHLIAAAPDLLEALECVRIMLNETHPDNRELIAQIDKAIAKAEGK
jgi:hypothetical protein